MAERVDLQQKPDPETLVLPQVNQAVEDRLPVTVAGAIVVGDKKAGDALGGVGAHDRLDGVGSAIGWTCAPETLMMVQKLHWNGQPRPASKLV